MKLLPSLKIAFCLMLLSHFAFGAVSTEPKAASTTLKSVSIRVSAIANGDFLIDRTEPIEVCLYLPKPTSDETRATRFFYEEPIVVGTIDSHSKGTPNGAGKRISVNESVPIPIGEFNVFRVALKQKAGGYLCLRYCPKRELKMGDDVLPPVNEFSTLFDIHLFHETDLEAIQLQLQPDIFEMGFYGLNQVPIVSCSSVLTKYKVKKK